MNAAASSGGERINIIFLISDIISDKCRSSGGNISPISHYFPWLVCMFSSHPCSREGVK